MKAYCITVESGASDWEAVIFATNSEAALLKVLPIVAASDGTVIDIDDYYPDLLKVWVEHSWPTHTYVVEAGDHKNQRLTRTVQAHCAYHARLTAEPYVPPGGQVRNIRRQSHVGYLLPQYISHSAYTLPECLDSLLAALKGDGTDYIDTIAGAYRQQHITAQECFMLLKHELEAAKAAFTKLCVIGYSVAIVGDWNRLARGAHGGWIGYFKNKKWREPEVNDPRQVFLVNDTERETVTVYVSSFYSAKPRWEQLWMSTRSDFDVLVEDWVPGSPVALLSAM